MSVTDVGVVFSFYATVYCVLTPFFGWILKKTVSKHHNYLLSARGRSYLRSIWKENV